MVDWSAEMAQLPLPAVQHQTAHTNRLARERVPCDGGLVSSNSVVGGTSSHVADVPPLKVHEGFGVHGVVA